MYQCYSNIIDCDLGAHGYIKEIVDGINAVDKRYIYQLMSSVQFPGSNRLISHMQMNTGNRKYDKRLVKYFQRHLTKYYRNNGLIDH